MFYHVVIKNIQNEEGEEKFLLSCSPQTHLESARQEHKKIRLDIGNTIASIVLYDLNKRFPGLDSVSIREEYEYRKGEFVTDAKTLAYKIRGSS